MIHSLLDVMYAKAPYTVISRAMHIHPTVTELVPTLLGQLETAAVRGGAPIDGFDAARSGNNRESCADLSHSLRARKKCR